MVAGLGIAFFEKRIVAVLVAYSVVYVTLFIINAVNIQGLALRKAVTQAFFTASPFALSFAVIVVVLRRVALWRAWRTIQADKARYDAMWEGLVRQPESGAWLAEVHEQAPAQPAQPPRMSPLPCCASLA